jgi:hypothetical protein
MNGRIVPADVKRTSVLRRVPRREVMRLRSECGHEGDVCAFELPHDAFAITVEAPGGRAMTIASGDTFLATPGHRESTRWVCGGVPAGGLLPGNCYHILADSGVVGEVFADSPSEHRHLACARYLGAVCGDRGDRLNVRQFAVTAPARSDRSAPVYLLVGTSGDSGKTTAGVAVLRTLRMKGHAALIALKATGTASFTEISRYLDFGAAQAFDCIDFGLPTTYPSGREGIGDIFANALDFCFSLPVDALVVECGGDLVGANVPQFLACLKTRCADPKIVLAAGDALGALGAKHVLAKLGLEISLITGPCTDTPALRERTETLCGIPAINLCRGPARGDPASF